MKKLIAALAMGVLLTGCVSNPPVVQKPYPVSAEYRQGKSPCRVAFVIEWSTGKFTVDVVPEDMICPESI